MYRYRGEQNGLFKVEDTEDGAIDLLNGDELRVGLMAVGEIDGIYIDDNGHICNEWGTILVKAPPPGCKGE